MQSKVTNTTKMAFQAMIAILIAETFSYLFHMERAYWATLTAMSLTAQTWGESIKKSLERILMTILGGSLGTLLYFILPHHQSIMLSFLLIFVFFSVYSYRISFLISIFFITGFVVFLFAIIDRWTLEILQARIIETIIGALIALLTSRFVFPLKTNTTILFYNYLEKIVYAIRHNETIDLEPLVNDYQILKQQATMINYELFFQKLNKAKFNELLLSTQQLMHYATSFIEASQKCKMKTSSQWLEKTKEHVLANLDELSLSVKNNKSQHTLLPINDIDNTMLQIIEHQRQQSPVIKPESIEEFSQIYFLDKLNLSIIHCHQILFQQTNAGPSTLNTPEG
jgi:uncharacterized membrane protein YgaE (UPF0421/DUF939 family)